MREQKEDEILINGHKKIKLEEKEEKKKKG
jgi:hypothetical protein